MTTSASPATSPTTAIPTPSTPKHGLADLATPDEINDAINQGITDAAAQNIADWMGAADALIDLCVDQGACLSSGEVSTWLRTYRPDLRFSVTSSIGEHLRNRHAAGTMPMYDSVKEVVQLMCTTAGFSRTPYGTDVYVYGPDEATLRAHDFEVEIPQVGGQIPSQANLPAPPVQAATPLYGTPTTPPPTRSYGGHTATVHTDRRVCIRRATFEALAGKLDRGLRGGDSVWLSYTGSVVTISLDDNGGTEYKLASGRGRLLFPSTGTAFTPNDTYAVDVTGDGLVLDLGNPQ